MTTDELVAQVIRNLKAEDDSFQWEMSKHVRRIVTEHEYVIFSVALNDETRDVRYVKHSWEGEHYSVYEVFPHTVVRTEYRKAK